MRSFQNSEGGRRLTTLENLLAAVPGQDEDALLATLLKLPAVIRRERRNLARGARRWHCSA